MSESKESITEIFSGTLWEAGMVKNLLELEEIESFLKNSVVNDYAYGPIYADGVKVMISNTDFNKAKEVVDDYYKNMKTDQG